MAGTSVDHPMARLGRLGAIRPESQSIGVATLYLHTDARPARFLTREHRNTGTLPGSRQPRDLPDGYSMAGTYVDHPMDHLGKHGAIRPESP